MFLFLSLAMSAQSPLCNLWYVEYCESPQTPDSGGPGCVDGDDCSPVYYYFYLRPAGSSNGSGTFTFRQLNISGQLVVTANPLATSKKLSHLNAAKTFACSPQNINVQPPPDNPALSVDPDGNFAYEIINHNNSELDVSLNVTNGRKFLFAIAIDAFPDEVVTLGGISFSFSFSSGGNVMTCNGLAQTCNNNGLSGKSVSVPAQCANNDLTLRFGTPVDAPEPGYPKRKKVPVYLASGTAGNYSIDKLDFLATVSTTQNMGNILIESGQIPASDVLLYNENGSTTNRRIYANTGSLSISTTGTQGASPGSTLFTIVADGPALESDCGTITLNFTSYRRIVYMGSCCQPRAGFGAQVSWNSGNCPSHCEQTQLSVQEATTNLPPVTTCQDAYLDVFIQNSSQSVTYQEASFSLMLQHSGTLDWNDATSSSIYCGNIQFCATATSVSSDMLRIDFAIDGSVPISLSPPGGANQLARLAFKGDHFCISSVTFADALLLEEGNSTYCLPAASSAILEGNNVDDICTKNVVFKYTVFDGAPLNHIHYAVSINNCSVQGTTQNAGSESICPCKESGKHTFVPSRDDNPLNGVTTFDLVLISKHILGIQPLGSPYKMIAADANLSNSVTTFDIVELRKLILGIYQNLPSNTSWRFIDKTQIFTNPANPFVDILHENVSFDIPPNENTVEFLGIKIGDVNNTVAGDLRPSSITAKTALAYGSMAAHTGAEIEVPVFANQNLEHSAWQMALHYDPARLQLLDVRWPSSLGAFQDRDWHEPTPGEIRLLWYDGEGNSKAISNGTPLFYLKFKSLSELTDPALALDGAIPCLSYSAAGEASALQLRGADVALCRREEPATTPAAVIWSAEVYPNPAGAHFRADISVPEATSCHIVIFDMLGRSCWEYKAGLNAGLNNLSQTPNLPAGQYLLQCDTDLGRKTLRFEKR